MRSSKVRTLNKETDLFNTHSLWTKSSVQSKHAVSIHIQQMNDVLSEMKGKPLQMETQKCRNKCFINTVFNNLHNENHVKQCFKQKCAECRMKLPKREVDRSNIVWSEENHNFCDWKGNQHTRNLFTFEQKRKFEDCFVNTHSEIASALLNCNTNICETVDGGSMSCMT